MPACPVVFWLSVGILAASIVPEDMLPAFSDVRPAPLPLNPVDALIVPTTSRATVGSVDLPMESECSVKMLEPTSMNASEAVTAS